MPTDVQNAAPSAAASESVLSVPTTAKDYSAWRLHGTLPTKPAEAAPAKQESEPTNPDEAAASTSEPANKTSKAEAEPDPESGKQQEHRKGKASASERVERLRKENADLEAELKRRAELRRQLAESPDDKKAEASTAKPEAKREEKATDGKPQAPTKPKWEDFKDKENGYELYEAAKDEYNDKNADYKADLKLWEYKQQQAQERAQREFQETVKQAKERYPDYESKVAPAAKLILEDPDIHAGIKARINNSTVWADVIYVMGSDSEKLQDFLDLAKSNPGAAYDELVLLERDVREELAGKPSKSSEAKTSVTPERNDKGQFQKAEAPEKSVPEKKVTDAPPPPEEVGTRGSTPPDQVANAVKKNDMRAFREERNRADLARRKGL